MNTKSKATPNTNETFFASFKDLSYRACKDAEGRTNMASWILERCPDFAKEIPDEVLTEIKEGQILRFAELNPAVYYKVADGNYIPCEQGTKGATKVDVHFAYSFTQQQFGRMSETHSPQLKGIVGEVRTKFSTYSSNRLKDLKTSVKNLIAERSGKSKERSPTKDFSEVIKDTFETLTTRCKTAKTRGDESANEQRFKEAKLAFMTKWNHS